MGPDVAFFKNWLMLFYGRNTSCCEGGKKKLWRITGTCVDRDKAQWKGGGGEMWIFGKVSANNWSQSWGAGGGDYTLWGGEDIIKLKLIDQSGVFL